MGAVRKQNAKRAVTPPTPIEITRPEAPTATGLAMTVAHGDLIKALAAVRYTADTTSVLPMLGHARIAYEPSGTDGSGAGFATFATTDLTVTVTARVPATCTAPGALTVAVKRLQDVGKSLPVSDVAVSQTTDGAYLASGRVGVTLEAWSACDFPKLPTTDKAVWHPIDGGTMDEMLTGVEAMVCKDETRFHLASVLFESTDGESLTMVATDGHRLTKARRVTSCAPTPPRGVVVPAKAVADLRRLLHKGAAEIAITASHLYVRQGCWTLISKTIDCQYPPYTQVIPQDQRALVTVDREALITACKRAKLAASDGHGMALTAYPGSLLIAGRNDEIKGMTEELDAEYTGDPVKVGCNPQYLIELLARIDGERVVLSIGAELDPIIARSLDDATQRPLMDSILLGVIMPMRT